MLSVFFFLLMFSENSHSQSGVPQPGLYRGSIQLLANRATIPIQVALNLSQDQVPAEAEDIAIAKRVFRASFVIDDEAGPYNFSSVSYFIEDGRFDFIYLRSIDGPGSSPRFRLKGQVKKDRSIAGEVITASEGIIGSFTMKWADGEQTPLSIIPKYLGTYTGQTRLNNEGQNRQVTVSLSSGVGTDVNPGSYDFDFSPRKSGSLIIEGTTPIAFTRVNTDYLRRRIEMVVIGGNGELSIKGSLAPDQIDGNIFSPTMAGKVLLKKGRSP